MQWQRGMRLGTLGGAMALSACMMPYDGGQYQAPPPPVYSADENPDSYAFIDRADSLWEAIGNAPPDYAFAFEGAEPWAWELQDGDSIIVEETSDGIQSYYFGPGDGGPYLAVRPGMSFGFEGEAVAVVYGPDGGAMPRDAGVAHLEEGVALYARGRALRRAMLQRQWREVDSQAWIDASPFIWGTFQLWDEGRYRYPGWERHRGTSRDAQWRHRLEAEQLRRRLMAEQFRRWREGGFQGPPPGRFHRPGEGHGPGAGRPGRPGEPGTGRPPRQPGQSGRPGGSWNGRPPQPGVGQPVPGVPRGPRGPRRPEVEAPGSSVTDTPQTTPGAGVPRRPGWGGRPRPGRVEGAPGAEPQPPAATPRPNWTGQRPQRPEGGRPSWPGRRPDVGAGLPSAAAPQPRSGRTDAPRPERSAPAPRSSEPRSSPPPAPRPAPSRPSSAETLGKRPAPETPE